MHELLVAFYSNCALFLRYWSNITDFNLPHPVGATPFKFHRDLWYQELLGLVSVILCLAILVDHWLVTNRQTQGHSHSIYNASIVSHSRRGSCDPDHAHLRVVCHHKANTWYKLPVPKIWFDDCSFTRSRDVIGVRKNLIWLMCMTMTTPLLRWFVIRRLGLAAINLCANF